MSGIIDLTGDDDIQTNCSSIDLESDDEELKMAIAMSLQSQRNSPGLKSTTVDTKANRRNTGDVKQAIALSLQPRVVVADSSQKQDEPEKKAALAPTQALAGILGLNRKAMEAERLARLKRKRGMDGQPPSPPSRRISPPPLRRAGAASISANSRQPSTTARAPSDNPFSFTNSRVLLTSTPSRHSSSSLEAISFRDVVSPPSSNYSLKSVLASSFIVDFDWLLPHFNTATTKFIFVLHAQNDQHRQLLQQDFAGVPNVRLVIPEHLGGGGNMHSKIMLLIFKDDSSESSEEICRVVVPSANLTPADWGVGGVMENVAFVVDLPLWKATSTAQIETQFKKEVQKQIRAMGVTEDVLRKLENFDFGATRDVGFVHSMSGSRALQASFTLLPDKKNLFGANMASTKMSQGASDPQILDQAQDSASIVQDDPARTGLLSLQDTIHCLGLSSTPTDPSYPPRLDFITSSLGNLSTPFVRQLYQAACGQLDPTITASATATKRGKSGSSNDDANLDELIKRNLCIYFPSDETVKKSKGGPNAAGTICFQKKWWETNNLVRDVLCDCVGVRDDGILMHNKILYARFKQPKAVSTVEGKTKWYAGWAYVGSGNLSESAWGRIVADSKSRLPKLTCRNWESGVVIPVPVETPAESRHPKGERHQVKTQAASKMPLGSYDAGRRFDKERMLKPGCDFDKAGAAADANDRAELNDAGDHLATHDDRESVEHAAARSLREVFTTVLPVPIHYPAQRHAAHRKRPWFFMD